MAGRAGRTGTVTAAALLAASATGLAATTTVDVVSHISIKSSGLKFSGRVTAASVYCRSGRKVTLHRTNGNLLGSATTDANGKWKITASGSAGITLGHFFAKVSKNEVSVGGPRYACKAATSRTIPYHR